MRTDLDHLPASKQRELERVVQILFEEFEKAHGEAEGRRKRARVRKIILYGSYARGGWIEEPHTAKGYRSDFDLLIIVNQSELTDRATYWYQADERLMRERSVTHALQTPVNFIVHTLQQVNDALSHGRYFFMDIAAEGIVLYQDDDSELSRPKPKTPQQAYDLALEYFEESFPSAMRRFKLAQDGMAQGFLKEAAFDTHQTVEFLYHCLLLVCTFYTPHNHNIAFLRAQAERLDERLRYIWPSANHTERAMFQKLKDAYVKARYSKHYRISQDELRWLAARAEELGRVVHEVCSERLAALHEKIAKGIA